MSEVYNFQDDDLRSFISMKYEGQNRELEFMNDLARTVVSASGFCDENVFVAAMTGYVNTEGERIYDDSPYIPSHVRKIVKRARKLDYLLGEPFITPRLPDRSNRFIGVVGRTNDDLNSTNPVTAFRLRTDGPVIQGEVIFRGFETSMDSQDFDGSSVFEESKLYLRLMRSDMNIRLNAVGRSYEKYEFGMPNIRKAYERSSGYRSEDAWRTLDTVVAGIRQFAGEALVGRQVFAAD